jgi:hypoxanthine phosphoribosyltransferase
VPPGAAEILKEREELALGYLPGVTTPSSEGAEVVPVFTAREIEDKVREIGRRITEDFRGHSVVLVCVLKGSFIFAADLVRAIDLPLRVEFLGVRSYGNSTVSSGAVQITQDLTRPVEGDDVIVVEDIVDTGLTLSYILDLLSARRARSVKVCAFLHKPARSRVPVTIDYLGFTIDDVFVVGYGLDYGEKYRNLPYLGELRLKSPE